jgi:predicted O-methyltransferase YrrM
MNFFEKLRSITFRNRITRRNRAMLKLYAREFFHIRPFDLTHVNREFPEIEREYDQYTQKVSNQTSAVSVQASKLIWFLLQQIKPQQAMDTGSGFSSFLLRKWAKTTADKPVVFSVDDNEFWLAKTSEFLTNHQLDTDNLLTYKQFASLQVENKFDFIFHDLGAARHLRIASFPAVVKACKPGGFILVDDIHKEPVEEIVMTYLKSGTLTIQDTTSITLDNFNRYAWLVRKN